MYEVELKAHVYDVKSVKEKLDSFAVYADSCSKEDSYYVNQTNGIQVRLRHELYDDKESLVVTYKKKTKKTSQDGSVFEVNEEKEFVIDSQSSFEAFIFDAGFSVLRKKQKKVSQWKFEDALLELCNVPPLGDFLEIEILCSDNDEETVSVANQKLLKLLDDCGIQRKEIEPLFYNQLLDRHNF